MAWTTSENLREFFASRKSFAALKLRVTVLSVESVGRVLRRTVIVALAMTHLLLLGELAVSPTLVSANAAISLSLPWLTITGLMLAIIWLARDLSPNWESNSGPMSIVAATDTDTQLHRCLPNARPLAAQNRADPMTGLLARVSHDLRTPLNAVMGFSDLMQQEAFGPLGDARYQSYARHIHASSAELLKAAEDTLAMTSLVASPHYAANEVVDLHELISDAFTMALVGAQPPHIRSNVPPLPPIILVRSIPSELQIKCERRALRQAMINLISAALNKVAVDGGRRTVYITATTDADVINLTVRVTLADPSPNVDTPGHVDTSSWNSAEDLPICLARALLELQGLSLLLTTTQPALGGNTWNAQVVLDGVSQSDFFIG
jgi:signal transduction histidine kinase